MNKKHLCLSIAILSLSVLFGQDEGQKVVDSYKKAMKESLPLEDEGMRSRNELLLDSIASDLETSREGSFEYHIVAYMNSSEKVKDAYHLQQAMALSPEDPDLIGEAIEYYGMISDNASIEKMTSKLRKYGLYRNHDKYYSDFNSLMNENDILFTNGASDTRPLLMNRSESNAGYEIIRIAWLSDPLYLIDLRARGINCPVICESPSEFIREVSNQNPLRGVLLSPTLNSELLSKFDSQLIANGLGLSIGTDLTSDLRADYEKIRSRFIDSDELSNSVVGMNYLPLLRGARLAYLQIEDSEKAEEIALIIHSVLSSNGHESLEEQLLK